MRSVNFQIFLIAVEFCNLLSVLSLNLKYLTANPAYVKYYN